ncbi:hypothetical protein HY504_01965 [Candidatus Wolfebacteria bacterium]|nr:hypothetical protein [Candidatus Wolfebacteria bacterium]
MIKKRTKKKKGSTASESHFGVILEDIDSKLDLVVDGHAALDVKFTKKFEEVNEKLGEHTWILKEHTKILGEHTEKIDNLTEMVAKNTEDIEIVREDIEIMKTDLHIIKNDLKEKVSRDEFRALEKRLTLVERKLAYKA